MFIITRRDEDGTWYASHLTTDGRVLAWADHIARKGQYAIHVFPSKDAAHRVAATTDAYQAALANDRICGPCRVKEYPL